LDNSILMMPTHMLMYLEHKCPNLLRLILQHPIHTVSYTQAVSEHNISSVWVNSDAHLDIDANVDFELFEIHMSTVVNQFLIGGTKSLTICPIINNFARENCRFLPANLLKDLRGKCPKLNRLNVHKCILYEERLGHFPGLQSIEPFNHIWVNGYGLVEEFHEVYDPDNTSSAQFVKGGQIYISVKSLWFHTHPTRRGYQL
jgi:hypothetical protein